VGWRSQVPPSARQPCCARTIKTAVPALIGVPGVLALLSAIQNLAPHKNATEFLLLPPFAVIAYLVFQNPRARVSHLRSIVILPCLGAISGQLCFHYLGFSPIGVAAATSIVFALQAVLRADMPPALALAVLAMLLHTDSPTYTLGVLEGTLTIFIVFRLWLPLAVRTARREQ